MRLRGIPGAPAAAACDTAATRATDPNRKLAFFAIDGMSAPIEGGAIEAIVESTFGIAKGSVRVSVETASLSLAFDPQRVAFVAVLRILDRKLARLRLSLLPMRVVDTPTAGESP